MTTVICIKLNSGEELIAKLHNTQQLSQDGMQMLVESQLAPGNFSNADKVLITEPLVIGMQPVGPNKIGVGFMPWAVGNTGTNAIFAVRVDAMACMPYAASLDLERGYLQQISGLDLSGTTLAKPN